MFERFTDRARHCIVLAKGAAGALHHPTVEPEHLLLAFVRYDDDARLTKIFNAHGMTHTSCRSAIIDIVGKGTAVGLSNHLLFARSTKQVLASALSESLLLQHNYITEEHLALGLIDLIEDEEHSTEVINQVIAAHQDVDMAVLRSDIKAVLLGKRYRSSPPDQHQSVIHHLEATVFPSLSDLPEMLKTVADCDEIMVALLIAKRHHKAIEAIVKSRRAQLEQQSC